MDERYLITGAAGFVGANVARLLHARGEDVHVLVRAESDPWRIADLGIQRHTAGLDSMETIGRVLRDVQPTCLIHFAAYGGYLGRQVDERLMFETNVLGTWRLLQAAEAIPYRAFLNIGSSSEYGRKTAPMSEADLPEPVNVYGVSKASQTLLCQAYARMTGRPVCTVRLFSVYGPYEPWGRLVPNVVLACLEQRPVKLAGGGRQARDFISVTDVAEGLARIAGSPGLSGQIINLGTGRQTTVANLAELAKSLAGSASAIEYDALPEKGIENPVWVADLTALERRLGWRPEIPLEDGLARAVDWYRENRHWYRSASAGQAPA